MKYIVKLGGRALKSIASGRLHPRNCGTCPDGNQVAVVHGGGVQLTRMLKALGKQSEFIAPARHRC